MYEMAMGCTINRVVLGFRQRAELQTFRTTTSRDAIMMGGSGMNQTQATVGIGGSALTAALTTALTGNFGLDAAQAAAYAFLILFVLGALYSLAAWYVSWKWPSAP